MPLTISTKMNLVRNNDAETKSLGQILQDSREAFGLSRQKFSQVSGISEEIINEIESGDFKRIASAPYLKGILKKYSRFVGVDYSQVSGLVKDLKTSGSRDILPPNRFSSKTLFKLTEFNPAILVLLALVLYLGFQFVVLALPQKIVLNDVPSAVSSDNIIVSGRVSGKTKDFSINSERVELDKGEFSKNVYLNSEINIIEFKATNFFNREMVVRKMVILKSE